MKVNNGYIHKVLHFNPEDPKQMEICDLLDKVRYFQTKLIVKLLDDFFKSKGITITTPYDKVRKIVQLYIQLEDADASASITASSPSSIDTNALTNVLLTMLASQVQNNTGSVNSIESVPVPSGQQAKAPSDTEFNPFPMSDFPEDASEDESDEGLMKMAQGFFSMADD